MEQNSLFPSSSNLASDTKTQKVLSVRLTQAQIEEQKKLGLKDKEYFEFLQNKNSAPIQQAPEAMTKPIEMKESKVDTDLIAKSAKQEAELEFLRRQLAEKSQGLAGIDNLIEQRLSEREKQREFNDMTERIKELEEKNKKLVETVEELEAENDEMLSKLQMKEVVKEFAPHLARVVKGYKQGGVDGALDGLVLAYEQVTGDNLEGDKSLESGLSDLDKQKIEFSDNFVVMYPDKEDQKKVMTIVTTLSNHKQLLDKNIEFLRAVLSNNTVEDNSSTDLNNNQQ